MTFYVKFYCNYLEVKLLIQYAFEEFLINTVSLLISLELYKIIE